MPKDELFARDAWDVTRNTTTETTNCHCQVKQRCCDVGKKRVVKLIEGDAKRGNVLYGASRRATRTFGV